MKLYDFDFELPKELIAQFPIEKRDHSDLLIVDNHMPLKRSKLFNIVDYLRPGDVIVLNNTKVIKAKLNFIKGTRNINCNLIECVDENIWKAFASPARKLQEGDVFYFDKHQVIVKHKMLTGEIILYFNLQSISVLEFLEQYGSMPLPPYIKRSNTNAIDEERYQTVFSNIADKVPSTDRMAV